jgi:hypothetical protein
MMPIVDKILNFTISKKLSVFIIATFLIFSDKLNADQWLNVAIVYIGTQGTIDIFIKILEFRKK